MKNVIRFVILFLIISVPVLSADEMITRSEAVREIVSALYETQIIESFDFENNYCIHEKGYVHFVPVSKDSEYPVLCELYNHVEGSGFFDVSIETKNGIYITLAKGMGIIEGNGDNTFTPDGIANINEIAKMLVCAAGLGDTAENSGGYPDGYAAVAKSFDFFKDLTYENKEISRNEFDIMLSNFNEAQSPRNITRISFKPPLTAEECVIKYAEAVKNRNGALQYALMADDLRKEKRDDFESFNWITGVSSPWVTEFEIEKADDSSYKITFHYATSTGAGDDNSIMLKTDNQNDLYSIISIIEE